MSNSVRSGVLVCFGHCSKPSAWSSIWYIVGTYQHLLTQGMIILVLCGLGPWLKESPSSQSAWRVRQPWPRVLQPSQESSGCNWTPIMAVWACSLGLHFSWQGHASWILKCRGEAPMVPPGSLSPWHCLFPFPWHFFSLPSDSRPHGPHPGEAGWHFYNFILIPTCRGVLADGQMLI